MIFGAAAIEAARAPVQAQERPRRVSSTPESQAYRPITESEVSAQLRQEKYERIFLHTNADTAHVLFEIPGGRENFFNISLKDVDKFCDSRETKVTELLEVHTHPLGNYAFFFKELGYDDNEVQSFVKGEKPWPPAPPSWADLWLLSGHQQYYADRKISVSGQVFEPSGSWFYKVNPESPLMKDLTELAEVYQQKLARELSPLELEIIRSELSQPDKDPRGFSASLKQAGPEQDPDGARRNLSDKLAKIEDELMKTPRFRTAVENSRAIEAAGQKVLTAPVAGRTEAVSEYLDLCAKNGIQMTRSPR